MSGRTVIAGFEPNARQLDAARAAIDPAARVVVLDGAIRSGKTQAAARIVTEWCVAMPATYLVGRATYRSLRDSTLKAMVFGDGSMQPLIPPALVETYRASDELVRLKTGAEILFRSLEENQVGKILNLSLGGILVDQIEELDDGDAGERIFDTLLGRLSDPRGPRKLLAVANPAGLVSWQYRRLIDEERRDPGVRRVHFTLRDNAANLPADYVAAMEATKATRPHWYRSFILGQWGAFEGQAFAEFDEHVHVVEPFTVPAGWERFESLDHGASNPTCWLAWAADTDGNVLVHDEYYAPGLVSQHAPEIRRRRGRHTDVVCWADPSTGAKHGLTRLGQPASIRTEYLEHDIVLSGANNDRAAGYMRLLELLHIDTGRIAPPWALRPAGVIGAPRLYVSSRCKHLIAQLQSAPIAVDGAGAGEMVDPKWATSHGHAVDACRYGAMSRPSPTEQPVSHVQESLRPEWLNTVEIGRREYAEKRLRFRDPDEVEWGYDPDIDIDWRNGYAVDSDGF